MSIYVHDRPPGRTTVLMDVGSAVHQNAGLARYTERLGDHLLSDVRDEIALMLLYNEHHGSRLPHSLRKARATSLHLGQYLWRLSILASQVLRRPHPPLQALCDRTKHAVAPGALVYHATEHLLPYLNVPAILTVHDLIFERQPQHHTWKNRLFLKLGMPLFVRAASAIIAVSRHTRDDLVQLYGADDRKIHVIYEGVDNEFTPQPEYAAQEIRARYSPDTPYLLMVGTLEPRKNHLTAVRALAQLRTQGFPHNLLIAGSRGWLFEPIGREIERLSLGDAVRYLDFVPASDLPALYSAASCLLSPSLYEGFGLTVLEAMACGAPVVCSDVSSLPEIAGNAAQYVSPLDHQALAGAVSRLLSQPGLRNEMVARGLKQAARFRWSVCARQTADLYTAVAAP